MSDNSSGAKSKTRSELENRLAIAIREAGLPEPIREYKALENRKFLWDFAWEKQRLLVEVQGGIFRKGAHSTGLGIERDITKLNLATLAGYRSLQFSRRMILDGTAVRIIKQALEESNEK